MQIDMRVREILAWGLDRTFRISVETRNWWHQLKIPRNAGRKGNMGYVLDVLRHNHFL